MLHKFNDEKGIEVTSFPFQLPTKLQRALNPEELWRRILPGETHVTRTGHQERPMSLNWLPGETHVTQLEFWTRRDPCHSTWSALKDNSYTSWLYLTYFIDLLDTIHLQIQVSTTTLHYNKWSYQPLLQVSEIVK